MLPRPTRSGRSRSGEVSRRVPPIAGAVALALTPILALALLLSPPRGLAASGAASPRVFAWRTAVWEGREIAEVLARGEVVFRLRFPAGGLGPAERAAIVVERLERFFQAAHVETIEPRRAGGAVAVGGAGRVLVTVDPLTAAGNGSTPEQLAFLWANRLRQALGGDPLRRNPLDRPPLPIAAAAPAERLRPRPRPSQVVHASWYGDDLRGNPTANGERFDPRALTAAHRSLPFGTQVRVTYPPTGRSVVVRINDRGPFVPGREIDLSRRAAEVIGMLEQGVGRVRLEILEMPGVRL